MTLPLPDLRAQPDQLLADIADYVIDREIRSDLAYATARMPDGFARLRDASAYLPGLHPTAWTARFGHDCA